MTHAPWGRKSYRRPIASATNPILSMLPISAWFLPVHR